MSVLNDHMPTAGAILKIIKTVVDSVENTHYGKSGERKKAIAMKTVAILYKNTAPVVPFSDIESAVGDLIDSEVQNFNEEGEFYKDVHKEPTA